MGFYKSTLLDYPDHIASAVFTRQCNFRCPYCHNGDLVLEASREYDVDEKTILDHLNKRCDLLEGLVISGGEPTLGKGLLPFIKKVKDLGYKVKLDTNGSKPEILETLIRQKQVDYIAMDVKNTMAKYAKTAGIENLDKKNILKSIDLIIKSDIPHEFRTTVIREFHRREDLFEIASYVRGADAFYLQQFESTDKMLGKASFNFYTLEEMTDFKKEIEQFQYVSKVEIRGRF